MKLDNHPDIKPELALIKPRRRTRVKHEDRWVAPEHAKFGRYMTRNRVTDEIIMPIPSAIAFQKWTDWRLAHLDFSLPVH